MSNAGQIVAAVSGGAIWATAVMAAITDWSVRRKADRRERVELAARVILDSVASHRQRERPESPRAEPADGAIEVRSKQHLRLFVRRRPSCGPVKGGPAARQDRSTHARGR